MTGAVALAGVAGAAVAVGAVTVEASPRTASQVAADRPEDLQALLDERSDDHQVQVSRSGTRPVTLQIQQRHKSSALPTRDQDVSGGVVETVEPTDPREIARQMLADYGWSDQFSCFDELIIGESNWDYTATNPYSGAYGIPQALPPEKMATAGADWRTNPATQIEWGLDYIRSSYGTPCSALAFKQANNWY